MNQVVIKLHIWDDRISIITYITKILIDREPIIVIDGVNLAEDKYKLSRNINRAIIVDVNMFNENKFRDWLNAEIIDKIPGNNNVKYDISYVQPPIEKDLENLNKI